jgi:CheY-like chemotaxis protein
MPDSAPRRRPRLQEFQDLMRFRILDILLVATPYDAFVLEEAGELSERMLGEFRNLDLHYAPGLTAVPTGAEAIDLAQRQRRFNLLVTTPYLADMNAVELAAAARAAGLDVPVVLLARDSRELEDFLARHGLDGLESAFVWQGDTRILVAIVKSVEDRRNVAHDSHALGVQVILLVEDTPRQYSSFLPAMYTELFQHSQRVIVEGLNLSQKILRMRARPKILLCTTFEEAEAAFEEYADDVLGIVSDVEFPRGGVKSAAAGAELAAKVRASYPDIPILLHSSQPENEELARRLGTRFLLKGSPLLLAELGRVMLEDFGFGDFVFRLPDGTEIDRAADLRELEAKLHTVPAESVLFHATRNHFSRWLKARTAFRVAHALRPRRPDEYPSVEAMREYLTQAIAAHREEQGKGLVADFDRAAFDFASDFYRVGGGSLGGKARGLAFVRRLIGESGLRRRWPGVEIAVPPAVVLGTDVFDRFLAENDLRRFAIECEDDAEIARRFAVARFPREAALDLAAFLARARFPLAVRSSSLLEDSQHQPFTGVYDTLMLPNDDPDEERRSAQAIAAVKAVYASTFSCAAKAYLAATTYRLEEEKMAVILQRIVGSAHGERFYPTFSGVARSHNFYPAGPMRAEDGIVAVALGLGKTIVEGGACLRFCPRYPQHVPQLASAREALASTQRGFWALPTSPGGGHETMRERHYGLETAEEDGVLAAVGSTYSHENDALSDGTARPGTRVVTFAPILKHRLLPLGEILSALQEEGARGMGSAVEIEFAVELDAERAEFGIVQMRPLALTSARETMEIGDVDPATVLCRSACVLGNGRLDGLRDVVYVDYHRFDRAASRETAAEIARLNGRLVAAERPYLLIGVGRWGSRDPWLGIPVTWDQVAGARVIVEAGLRDTAVTPSQGSHFFQNLTAFEVGYFTIGEHAEDGFVDWRWLAEQPATSERAAVRHLRLAAPLVVKMDGRVGAGVVLKSGAGAPA